MEIHNKDKTIQFKDIELYDDAKLLSLCIEKTQNENNIIIEFEKIKISLRSYLVTYKKDFLNKYKLLINENELR